MQLQQVRKLFDFSDKAPLAASRFYGELRLNTSAVILCLGAEPAVIEAASNVDISGSFKDAIYDFRWAEELDHEEWLTVWFDIQDSGPAFEQDFLIVPQIGQAIR